MSAKHLTKKFNSAFTLIEVIAVLTLLGILAATAAYFMVDAREQAERRALDAAIAELNGREQLAWAQDMLLTGGRPVDATVFAAVTPTELGGRYSWLSDPVRNGFAELGFGRASVELRRTPSTATTAALWTRASGVFFDFSDAPAVAGQLIFQRMPNGTPMPDWDFSNGVLTPPATGFSPLAMIENTFDRSAGFSVGVNAALGQLNPDATSAHHGYGLFIDAVLDDRNRPQSGYAVQFDAGFGDGAIIIRRWENGAETTPPVLTFNNRDFIPRISTDPDWWRQSHNLTVSVSPSTTNPGQNVMTVFLNGTQLFSGFEYTAPPPDAVTHTGLRTWGSFTAQTQFQNLEIAPPKPQP